MAETSSPSIAVVGGGITGLSAAHALTRAGARVRLFEANDRVGGPVHSTREGEWLIESGPNSLQEASPAVTALITELGLDADRVSAQPEAKNRYILRDSRPVAAPTSPPGLFASKLFGLGTKLRVLTELTKRPRFRRIDISLAAFARAHFGSELVDYGIDPFVSGVYAGDAEKLSARHAFPSLWKMEREHGSLIRGQIAAAKARRAASGRSGPPPIISFREGLGQLPDALAASLPADTMELGSRVETLFPGEKWQLVWSRDGQTHNETFDRIILTLPAAGLARLAVGSLGERPLAALSEIVYPSVAALFLGYRRDQVRHALDGFGLLVPSRERRHVLGILFSSSLFLGRAPAGHVALTVMLGGSRRPDLGQAELDQILPLVRQELAELLGVTGDPVFVRHQRWPRAIPQYNLGYERFLEVMTATELRHAGLLIGGHVRDGIALPNCLAAGQTLAARALADEGGLFTLPAATSRP